MAYLLFLALRQPQHPPPTYQIHHHHSVFPSSLFSFPKIPISVLYILFVGIRMESITCRGLHVVTANLPPQLRHLFSNCRQAGRVWEEGDIMWRGQEFKVTQVGALVAVKFLWQTECITLRHFIIPLPHSLYICLSISPVIWSPSPAHYSVCLCEVGTPLPSLSQLPVGGPGLSLWFPQSALRAEVEML